MSEQSFYFYELSSQAQKKVVTEFMNSPNFGEMIKAENRHFTSTYIKCSSVFQTDKYFLHRSNVKNLLDLAETVYKKVFENYNNVCVPNEVIQHNSVNQKRRVCYC